jgi:hypothetical protein
MIRCWLGGFFCLSRCRGSIGCRNLARDFVATIFKPLFQIER